MERIASPAIYLAVLWLVHTSGIYTIMGAEGVHPKEPYMIEGIIAGALLHSGDWHILGNMSALIPLSIGLAIIDRRPWLTLPILIFAAGFLVWMFAGYGTGPHHGASDMIYALIGFLATHGFKQGNVVSIAIACAVLIFEGASTLMAIQPGEMGASWEGHLSGLVAGVAWGLVKPVDRAG